MGQLAARSRRRVAIVAGRRVGAAFAGLRRSDITLADARPGPLVVAVAGVVEPAATAAITAALGRALNVMAPGRVVVLEADGVGQLARSAVGSGLNGDLRALAAAVGRGASRRAVDAYLDFGGGVPVCAAAADAPRSTIGSSDLVGALALLRRRFLVVLVHVPRGSPADQVWWAGGAADHVVFAHAGDADLMAMRDWWHNLRPNSTDLDLTMTALRLSGVGLEALGLEATAAVADLAARVARSWVKRP